MSAGFRANVVDDAGNIQGTSTITVRNEAGGIISPSELFSDSDLTTALLSNPFTTNSQGFIEFFIQPQIVTVEAQKGAFSTAWDDIVLNDFVDVSVFATAAQGALADSALQNSDVAVGSVDEDITKLAKIGDWGCGSRFRQMIDYSNEEGNRGQFFREVSATIGGSAAGNFGGVAMPSTGVVTTYLKVSSGLSPKVQLGRKSSLTATPAWDHEFWTTANTTVDINGFVKEL